MNKETVVSAPRRARVDAPELVRDEAASRTHSEESRGAHYLALGRLALRKMRGTLGWHVDAMSVMTALDAHRAKHEGFTLGLIVATVTWVWVAIVDAVAGDPFRTFTVFGGVVPFTIAHYALNILYASVLVAAIRGTRREPTLMMALVFGFIMVEFAFAFVATVFSNLGLGALSWVRLFVGSLIGAAVALAVLARRYPLADRIRRAK